MYYLLIYHTDENYVEKRAPFRPEHLDYSNAALARGELVMGGALGDPPTRPSSCSGPIRPPSPRSSPVTIRTSRPD